MVLRGLTGAHPLKFQSQAFPESKKITVTVSFVDVASDSCTFHLTDGQELINCDKSIKATPGNIYHIEGNMILDQARGAIRFTGMAVLSNIAHIDFNDATVLVAR